MMLRRTALLAPLSLLAQPGASPRDIKLGGTLVTRLYADGYPKPFLYPILAPDGQELSRGWPVAPRPEDAKDHDWHRGIWWGHGDINGHDFWREKKDATGAWTTARIAASRVFSPDPSSWRLEQTLLTPANQPLGQLTTTYGFARTPDLISIDATLALAAPGDLQLGDTDDGGFAFRLREEFREDRGAALINSEGGKGAKAIWGKPAAWTSYSAQVNGRAYGVTILAHPSNPRHPSGWHARNYGLNSANPFAASAFAGEKDGQRGAYLLPAGETLRLRYRVLIHTGDAAAAKIPLKYQEYAKP